MKNEIKELSASFIDSPSVAQVNLYSVDAFTTKFAKIFQQVIVIFARDLSNQKFRISLDSFFLKF